MSVLSGRSGPGPPGGGGLAGCAGARGGSRSSRCSSPCPPSPSGSLALSLDSQPQPYVLLRHCLALTLRRTCSVAAVAPPMENDFWMYDNGYLLFRGLVDANARCFWSPALLEAMRELRFVGYVSPGVLLVRAGACALDVVRAAWARRVLKPPPNYVIAGVGDIEDCAVVGVPQSQFTPLPEALCWVILELTSAGQPAVLPAILRALPRAFPAITSPSAPVVYDALAKLSADRKVYQTARGYFLVTPETRRRLSHGGSERREAAAGSRGGGGGRPRRSVLLSNEEALIKLHGDMRTERDGHLTHQCVQTNLADVICGGNADDKVLYARPWLPPSPASSSAPSPSLAPRARSLERRHSLRLGRGLSARLGQALHRAGSLRSLPPRPPRPPSPENDMDTESEARPGSADKKPSLLSRLFRRSARPRGPRSGSGSGRRGQSAPPASQSSASQATQEPPGGPGQAGAPVIRTFGAQFPQQAQHPADWFNPAVRSLASTATQTQPEPEEAVEAVSASAKALHLLRARACRTPTDMREREPTSWDCPGRASTLPRNPRGSPRRPRRLSDALSVSLSGASTAHSRDASPRDRDGASLASCRGPGSASASACGSSASTSGTRTLRERDRKGSPSNTLLSSPSSRASRVSRTSTSGMSKASSGYNSAGTRNGSPLRKSSQLPIPTCVPQPSSPATDISKEPQRESSCSSDSTTTTTTTTTTTINGTNTKIFVQQHNSPVRSFITIENRRSPAAAAAAPHLPPTAARSSPSPRLRSPPLETSFGCPAVPSSLPVPVLSPAALSECGEEAMVSPTAPAVTDTVADTASTNKYFNNKIINNRNLSGHGLIKQASTSCSEESLTSAGSLVNVKEAVDMNNSRKVVPSCLSAGTPPAANNPKESLDYRNILNSSAASLSDLSVHCKSLAAQRILSGLSINSIDTLVEVNMAAAEKKSNCDVTIRTDFGMV